MIAHFLFFFLSLAHADIVSQALEAYRAQSHLSDVEVSIQASSTHYSDQMPLTIVALKNSVWTPEEVAARIHRTEEIYSQCELSFNPIIVVWAKYDLGNVWDGDTYMEALDFRSLTASAAPKPILFLIDAERTNMYGAGFAVGAHLYGLDEPAVNTAVLVGEQALAPNKSSPWAMPPTRDEYEVMAHELGHLLFMESHISEPDNLLSTLPYRNNVISESQCLTAKERFKAK